MVATAGEDAYVRSSVPVMQASGFPIDQLTVADAVRKYPQIDFKGVRSVWLERRAGALSARRACAVVRDAFEKAAGSYRTAHVETPSLDKSLSALRLVQARLPIDDPGPRFDLVDRQTPFKRP